MELGEVRVDVKWLLPAREPGSAPEDQFVQVVGALLELEAHSRWEAVPFPIVGLAAHAVEIGACFRGAEGGS